MEIEEAARIVGEATLEEFEDSIERCEERAEGEKDWDEISDDWRVLLLAAAALTLILHGRRKGWGFADDTARAALEGDSEPNG